MRCAALGEFSAVEIEICEDQGRFMWRRPLDLQSLNDGGASRDGQR
jgi:hypothetical protein